MPSGPKKRKAARKKKKLGLINSNNNNANNSNNNNVPQVSTSAIAVNSHSQGKEDLIHGGHKETDSGEVSYSASNDKKQLEIPHSESSIDKNKSNALKKGINKANKVAVEGGGIVQVKTELKLDGESMSHNINVERVEPEIFPHEGGLRRRSSSSSKPSTSEDIVQVSPSASDIDIVALHSFGSSEKENEKRELGIVDKKTTASDVFVDRGLEKSDDKTVATSDMKISVALRDDDKLNLSYDPPAVDVDVNADDMNSSSHQPLVALGPRPAETTSWKSCCGLFEVFAGSNK